MCHIEDSRIERLGPARLIFDAFRGGNRLGIADEVESEYGHFLADLRCAHSSVWVVPSVLIASDAKDASSISNSPLRMPALMSLDNLVSNS